jgi:hypothetical protein
MTRSIHLVGSWTARSPAMAMDNALERLAPHLHSTRYAPILTPYRSSRCATATSCFPSTCTCTTGPASRTPGRSSSCYANATGVRT